MSILLLGGTGRLGAALAPLMPGVILPTRDHLDLARNEEIAAKVADVAPSCIVNCAAYTLVDAAEQNEGLATLVNGIAVGILADAADALGIPFVTISTDYVFDGTSADPYSESSRPNPVNAYGRSKLVGEELALCYPRSLVVRTSWLQSATHPCFVSTIRDAATAGVVRVVDDQWGRPTLVSDLAPAIIEAVDAGVCGVLHLASPPTTSWFSLAEAAVAAAGNVADRVVACSTSEYPSEAIRPARSVLVSERVAALGLGPMPDWRPGLNRLVNDAKSR